MRDSVRQGFLPFTKPLEGVVPYMYLDVRGLVTTAIGDLIDPIELAFECPFVHADGTPASRVDIAIDWNAVKSRPELARLGHLAAKQYTRLHLTDEGALQIVRGKLESFWKTLAMRFPEIETWPADAQLATISMAWACGARFDFPRLEAALLARDFARAAVECHINETGNPGIVPRNRANKTLYRNAARVEAGDGELDPDVLYYPDEILVSPPTERFPIVHPPIDFPPPDPPTEE